MNVISPIEHTFLAGNERSRLLGDCMDILDDNGVVIHACTFKTRQEYESAVIKQAYELVRKNG